MNHDYYIDSSLKSMHWKGVYPYLFAVSDGHNPKGMSGMSKPAADASRLAGLMTRDFGFLALDEKNLLIEMQILCETINTEIPKFKTIRSEGATTHTVGLILPSSNPNIPDKLLFCSAGDSPLFTINSNGEFSRINIDHGLSYINGNRSETMRIQNTLDNVFDYYDLKHLETREKMHDILDYFFNRHVIQSSLGGRANLLLDSGSISLMNVNGIFASSDGIKDVLTTTQLTNLMQTHLSNTNDSRMYSIDGRKFITEIVNHCHWLLDHRPNDIYPFVHNVEALEKYYGKPHFTIRKKDDDRTALLLQIFNNFYSKPYHQPQYRITDPKFGEMLAYFHGIEYDATKKKYMVELHYKTPDTPTGKIKITEREYFYLKHENFQRILKVA